MTNDATRQQFARSLALGLLVATILGIVTALFAWRQVANDRRADRDDIDRRARALAQQHSALATRALTLPDEMARQVLAPQMEGYRQLIGYALFRPRAKLLATGADVAELTLRLTPSVLHAETTGEEVIESIRVRGIPIHALVMPIGARGTPSRGALVVVHDVSYIEARAARRLWSFGFWIVVESLLAVMLVVGTNWFAYEKPLYLLTEWMRRLRTENVAEGPPAGLPSPLLRSETDRLAASYRAARSTGQLLSDAAIHADQVWTQQRLRAHAMASLGPNRQLIVLSNREPYMHQLREGKPEVIVPAGGLVTAIDPVLQACGGVWIAHGAGDADRATADDAGRLTVPVEHPRYTLRRVWLSREEEQGYYYGFSNEGLWPLCHLAHERPVFRASDWDHYRRANERFASAVLDEIGDGQAMVIVQDYHLALVPRLLKAARPDQRVGLFWHIPWPSPDTFRICPWGAEIVEGMLGADVVGFHLQQYCNGFLETVDRVVESRLDRDRFAVHFRGQTSLVRPFPISVQSWSERGVPSGDELARQIAALEHQYKLEGQYVAVGVDRIDYTKGLPERFRAIDRFLESNPSHRGRFTFVELGAPSRTYIRRYRDHIAQLDALADEINWKYEANGWKPIRFLATHHDPRTVHAFLTMAPMCIVSSLHDGMNLVAKEFVSASEEGVLVLSEFAGAARELPDALIINPYDTERFAELIRCGVEMAPDERRARMSRMRKNVEEHNVYRWAAELITELGEAPDRGGEPGQGREDVHVTEEAMVVAGG